LKTLFLLGSVLIGQFGRGEDKQQALRIGLHACGLEQIVIAGDIHGLHPSSRLVIFRRRLGYRTVMRAQSRFWKMSCRTVYFQASLDRLNFSAKNSPYEINFCDPANLRPSHAASMASPALPVSLRV
jgi:hypothetical protein